MKALTKHTTTAHTMSVTRYGSIGETDNFFKDLYWF